jgi:hypothetical protein
MPRNVGSSVVGMEAGTAVRGEEASSVGRERVTGRRKKPRAREE